MASVRTRTSASGATTHAVLFRHLGRQTSRTFQTRQHAVRWARLVDQVGPDEALRLLVDERPGAAPPTLEEWLGHHLDHATGITTGTRIEYRRLAARTWLPQLGAVPVDLLTRDQVARWVGAQAQTRTRTGGTTSAKTIANAHGLLSTVIAAAVTAGLRPDNPCHGVRLPRGERHEIVFLSREDFADLLDRLPPAERPLVALLAGTGLRWSEATALTWGDLDLTGPSPAVRVTKAWKKTDGTGTTYEIGPPKTARAVRTVSLPAALAGDLAARKAAEKPPRTALVFTAARGGMLRHQNWHPRVWSRAVADLDPRPRIHDLRHTHASWLIAGGVPLPVIQRRLGHESITTTIDVYGHLDRGADAAAAAVADAALGAPAPVPDPAQPTHQDRVGGQRLRLVQ